MSNTNILFAGFGGQGVLFAAKLVASAGLVEGREVSWLPSYGPEMRGGTANCSVVLSDEPIGSPLVIEPDLLIALNQPSYDKFIDSVVPGGKVFVDSELVSVSSSPDGISVYSLPATNMCHEAGLKGLANVLMVGKLIREAGCCQTDAIKTAIEKSVPPKRQHLLQPNLTAFDMGLNDTSLPL